ncbi:MAG: DUF4124 domain-containing protein [Gammaproteobacteria bacterium]
MRTVLLLLAMLAGPALAAGTQTVWKWVDEHGVTHYSDRPVPGASQMEVSVGKIGTVPPSPEPPPPLRPSTPEPAGPPYEVLAITSPAPEEAIVNTAGQVQVSVRLEPALRPGHNLDIYLDGRRVESESRTATSRTLTEVPRGEHTLVAVVFDGRGNRVQESEPVKFYVIQTSIAKPPVGPALRTPQQRARPGAANKRLSAQPSYADLNGPRTLPVDPRTNLPVQASSQR